MSKGIGAQFFEFTKYENLEPAGQQLGEPEPPVEAPLPGSGRLLSLPAPPETPLKALVDQRTSVRNYAPQSLTLAELSYLLWCTQGVKHTEYGHTFRTVPSAGARHAIETVILANRVEGLQSGLYRFRALKHSLEEYRLGRAIADQVAGACWGQQFVKTSAVTFLWVAVPGRMTWRYGERGYRYLLLDAGHICQNLYLAAESIECGACAVAAFDDNLLNKILNLDGRNYFVIYLAAVGKKKGRR